MYLVLSAPAGNGPGLGRLKMLTRHMNELLARLERTADVGCAETRKAELLLWYGRDRMTKSVWGRPPRKVAGG